MAFEVGMAFETGTAYGTQTAVGIETAVEAGLAFDWQLHESYVLPVSCTVEVHHSVH